MERILVHTGSRRVLLICWPPPDRHATRQRLRSPIDPRRVLVLAIAYMESSLGYHAERTPRDGREGAEETRRSSPRQTEILQIKALLRRNVIVSVAGDMSRGLLLHGGAKKSSRLSGVSCVTSLAGWQSYHSRAGVSCVQQIIRSSLQPYELSVLQIHAFRAMPASRSPRPAFPACAALGRGYLRFEPKHSRRMTKNCWLCDYVECCVD